MFATDWKLMYRKFKGSKVVKKMNTNKNVRVYHIQTNSIEINIINATTT